MYELGRHKVSVMLRQPGLNMHIRGTPPRIQIYAFCWTLMKTLFS
jgi:hypothetical protein